MQEIELSADKDARWLKKGNKYYFGYKGFATTDEEGYITKIHTTPANKGECPELEKSLEGVNAKRVLADKAYDSKANHKMLKEKGFKDGLMRKATRNNPLSKRAKQFNKMISKKRFRVEQIFGTLKRKFKFRKARYRSTVKVNSQFILKAICLNFLKALNKVKKVILPLELRTNSST